MPSKFRFLQIFLVLGVVGALVAGIYISRIMTKKAVPTPNPLNSGNLEATGENSEQDIVRGGLNFGSIPGYVFAPTNDVTLVSLAAIPGTKITEQVWKFRINDQDYQFKNYVAVCVIETESVGENLSTLEIGSQYRLLFVGVEQPFSKSSIAGDLSPDCKTVWGNLRGDTNDMARLKNFFTSGKSEGLNVNHENGIVDLTNTVVLFQVVKK